MVLHPQAVGLLREQYQKNTAIVGFSSLKFYHKQLIANPLVANRLLQVGDLPFIFIDTARSDYEEKPIPKRLPFSRAISN